MEVLKYVYFCTHKSVIKAGNNKFQDLINVPRNCTPVDRVSDSMMAPT